jgi:hypothetical protein
LGTFALRGGGGLTTEITESTEEEGELRLVIWDLGVGESGTFALEGRGGLTTEITEGELGTEVGDWDLILGELGLGSRGGGGFGFCWVGVALGK